MSIRETISRRNLLQKIGIGASAVTVITLAPVCPSDAAPGRTQQAAKYQTTPKADHQCLNCNFFVAPGSCKLVKGTIVPTGWCQFWAKKPSQS